MNRILVFSAVLLGFCGLLAIGVFLGVDQGLAAGQGNSEGGGLVDSDSGQAGSSTSQRRELAAPGGDNTASVSSPHRLADIEDLLSSNADAALDGVLFVNDILDGMLEFARLPVDELIDIEYEDDDAVAYRLLGTPDGTEAHMRVGIQPYEEEDGTFRYLQLEVLLDCDKFEYILGAFRRGPSFDLSISYHVDDEYTPTRFAIMVHRAVDISESRRQGIDAYSGKYTNGAYYWVDDPLDGGLPMTCTVGIINGRNLIGNAFGGISPLAGDITLDTNRLTALLKQLQAHLATIKGPIKGQ